ncbi:hypothetical protein BDZ91DRAFT_712465 [Kalaharituber pfeilii]|nr:hypothetical protein BDZ91DRAFT_712465 [Kalaharituber pfeilii]
MDNHQAPGLPLAPFLPLTITNLALIPIAIPLGPSLQGTSQFLTLLPPGIELWGILYRWAMWGGGWHGQQDVASGLSYEPTMYTCNQLPNLANPFPEHDMTIPGDTISDLGFGNMFSAVPEPFSDYPEMVHYPIADCLLDANHDSTEPEIFSGIMDQRDTSMQFDSQNAQPILDAAPSQQSQVIFWMSPNIPNDFVPAPSLPEYGIRFEEPTIFMAPPFLTTRTHLSTDGFCVATSSRHI